MTAPTLEGDPRMVGRGLLCSSSLSLGEQCSGHTAPAAPAGSDCCFLTCCLAPAAVNSSRQGALWSRVPSPPGGRTRRSGAVGEQRAQDSAAVSSRQSRTRSVTYVGWRAGRFGLLPATACGGRPAPPGRRAATPPSPAGSRCCGAASDSPTWQPHARGQTGGGREWEASPRIPSAATGGSAPGAGSCAAGWEQGWAGRARLAAPPPVWRRRRRGGGRGGKVTAGAECTSCLTPAALT